MCQSGNNSSLKTRSQITKYRVDKDMVLSTLVDNKRPCAIIAGFIKIKKLMIAHCVL